MILQELIVPLLMNTDNFIKNITKAQTSAEGLRKGMTTLSTVTGGALVAGVGLATVAIGKSVKASAEWGETLDGIGDILGTTSKESAGLAYMVQHVGGSTEQLTSAMSIMTRGLFDATGGLGTTGKALDSLGISVYDSSGKVKDATTLFGEISDVIGNMPDGLEKSSLMMDIFGRSGAEMGDILGAAANGGLNDYIQKAADAGLALSDEETQAAIDFGKAQQDLDLTLQGLGMTLGTSLLPALSDLAESLKESLANPEMQTKIKDLATKLAEFAVNSVPSLIDLADKAINLTLAIMSIPEPVWKLIGVFTTLLVVAAPILNFLAGLSSLLTTLTGAFGIATGAGTSMGAILALLSNPIGWLIIAIVGLIATIVLFGKDAWNTVIMVREIILAMVQKAIWALGNLGGAFEGISNAIQKVFSWIVNLQSKLLGLKIPSWLTPGSPTPFEMGLLGINQALKKLNTTSLPEFSTQLNVKGVMPAGSKKVSSPEIQKTSEFQSFNYDKFASAVRDAVLQATG